MQFMLLRHTPATCQPEDDIDKLFHHLSRVEPPGELIARILQNVRRLPVSLPGQPDRPVGDRLDTLVVRNETCEPS